MLQARAHYKRLYGTDMDAVTEKQIRDMLRMGVGLRPTLLHIDRTWLALKRACAHSGTARSDPMLPQQQQHSEASPHYVVSVTSSAQMACVQHVMECLGITSYATHLCPSDVTERVRHCLDVQRQPDDSCWTVLVDDHASSKTVQAFMEQLQDARSERVCYGTTGITLSKGDIAMAVRSDQDTPPDYLQLHQSVIAFKALDLLASHPHLNTMDRIKDLMKAYRSQTTDDAAFEHVHDVVFMNFLAKCGIVFQVLPDHEDGAVVTGENSRWLRRCVNKLRACRNFHLWRS